MGSTPPLRSCYAGLLAFGSICFAALENSSTSMERFFAIVADFARDIILGLVASVITGEHQWGNADAPVRISVAHL